MVKQNYGVWFDLLMLEKGNGQNTYFLEKRKKKFHFVIVYNGFCLFDYRKKKKNNENLIQFVLT